MCNLIGTWVENGEYPADMGGLGKMVQDISSHNCKRSFGIYAGKAGVWCVLGAYRIVTSLRRSVT